MKIAFFVKSSRPVTEYLSVTGLLKDKSYKVFQTDTFEEIDQAGRQAEKIVLFFDDPNFAYKFCGEQRWSSEYKTLRLLYVRRKPIVNPVVLQKLRSVGLSIFTIGDEAKIEESILAFESDFEEVDEIEFSIMSDIGEESYDDIVAVIENEDLKLNKPFKKRK